LNAYGNTPIALAAAAAWGGGDFSGGMGVKAAGGSVRAALRFVILAHGISWVVLAAVMLLRHQPLASGALLVWGLVAGLAGGISLVGFYIALSRGAMGAAAAVSGLLAAAIPAVLSSWLEGAPGVWKLAGFALAAVAIWVIAAAEGGGDRVTMLLAIASGIGFGIYFVALRMDHALGVLQPMVLARSASILTCSGLLVFFRGDGGSPTSQKRDAHPTEQVRSAGNPDVGHPVSWTVMLWAVGVAVLDTGGNMLFVAATRLGRLDVSAVLASLYPASTILLAAWLLHERLTWRQAVGMGVAVVAVVLIAF
jgi:drug/metabolite transporter (DMT)-like permease